MSEGEGEPYLQRELAPAVERALGSIPVLAITGLRQAGKTTFLRREPALQGRRYLTLDDFATLEQARRNPEALLAGDEPITIDEAQRCPELFPLLKQRVDARRRPGRFVLSGSANFALLANLSESLAGRALYFRLPPLSYRELRRRISTQPFLIRFLERPGVPRASAQPAVEAEQILRGGLPPVALGRAERDLWFLGYEQTYLERDLRDLARITDLVSFRNVMRAAALRSGGILNQSELARDVKLPARTVGGYLDLLETSFVIERIPPFVRSRATRMLKSPKLYFADSGLACHLAGVGALDPAEPHRGAMLETWVAQNLRAILSAHLPRADLCFWHVQGRHEVDFVVSAGRSAVAIEVKGATRFDDRDLAGLRALRASSREVRAGILAYAGERTIDLGDDLYAIPLPLLVS